METKVLGKLQSLVQTLDNDLRPEISEPKGQFPGEICFSCFEPLGKIEQVALEICELLKQNGYQILGPKYDSITMTKNAYIHHNILKCTITYSKLK